MANVLDLRRRIRSVKNTRQITKAMKMVSAAKLRRAQERAMPARPYAQMLASVLESLMRRIEMYDPETGECATRCWCRARRRTCCSSSSPATRDLPAHSTPTSSRPRFSFIARARRAGQIDIEAIGRKARDSSAAAIRSGSIRRKTEPAARTRQRIETELAEAARRQSRRARTDRGHRRSSRHAR